MSSSAPLKVAVLGCGVVGSEVVRILQSSAADLAARIGAPLELAGVAVRRANRQRDLPVDPSLFTTDAAGLAARDDVDIVVEVVGGTTSARDWILTALNRGASVVTANKALLAERGQELYAAAERNGVDLYYEAAVAGAIPIVRPMRESLVGDSVHRVMGIVNGTTNFILTRMEETGAGFAEALDEATSLGYAEADPTADIEGFDAAAKAAILASLAFHTNVTAADVHREGITGVTSADVASARAMNAVVKLLAIAERSETDGSVGVRVHPAMIPRTHPLAGVREAYNAVFVEGAASGQLMFYGKGAGGAPTASAVLGDVVAAARKTPRRRTEAGQRGRRRPGGALRLAPAPWDRRDRHPLSREPRRGRQGRRARCGRRRVLCPRREHPQCPPGGPGRRRVARPRHPRRDRQRARRDRRRAPRPRHRPAGRQRDARRRRIVSQCGRVRKRAEQGPGPAARGVES